jgi:hypothetical protein
VIFLPPLSLDAVVVGLNPALLRIVGDAETGIAYNVHGLLLGWYLKNVPPSYRTKLKK